MTRSIQRSRLPSVQSPTAPSPPLATSSRTIAATSAPGGAADQRVERDLALEQAGDLEVGGADAVHHLDRAAVGVERAARRQHDRGGGGERDQQDDQRGDDGQRGQRAEHRREPRLVGDELRRGHRALDRGGDRGGIGAGGELDVDQRGQRQVGAFARGDRAEPLLERGAKLGLGHRRRRWSRRAPTRAAATARASLARPSAIWIE